MEEGYRIFVIQHRRCQKDATILTPVLNNVLNTLKQMQTNANMSDEIKVIKILSHKRLVNMRYALQAKSGLRRRRPLNAARAEMQS